MTEHFLASHYRVLADYTAELYRFRNLTLCFGPFAILFSSIGVWLDLESYRIGGGLFAVATLIFALYYVVFLWRIRALRRDLDGATQPRTLGTRAEARRSKKWSEAPAELSPPIPTAPPWLQ